MTPQWELDQELDDAYERAYRHSPRWRRIREACCDQHGLPGTDPLDRHADLVFLTVTREENGPGRKTLGVERGRGQEGV